MKELQLRIIHFLQRFDSAIIDALAKIITICGESIVAIGVIIFIYYCVDKKFGRKLLYIVITSNALNGIIKNFVKAPRPYQDDSTIKLGRADTATGYSFPSGHTQNSATLYFSLAQKLNKKWCYIVASILVLLIAVSRSYLGAHYPVDVLVGAILGILYSFIVFKNYEKVNENKLYIITCIVIVPFMILFAIQNDPIYKDFFSSCGIILGATLGIILEKKYVNFELNVSNVKKVLRFIIGVAFIYGIKEGLKLVLPSTLIFESVRYFAVGFVGTYIWPIIFKKLKF